MFTVISSSFILAQFWKVCNLFWRIYVFCLRNKLEGKEYSFQSDSAISSLILNSLSALGEIESLTLASKKVTNEQKSQKLRS